MVLQLTQPSQSHASKQHPLKILYQPSPEIKQTLRDQIQNTLQIAKQLPPELCLQVVKERLLSIQRYCGSVGKTFIVVEEAIACHQYELRGARDDRATLFRGPDEQASVAICVTQKGSLLHRNDSVWAVYRNAGDVLLTQD